MTDTRNVIERARLELQEYDDPKATPATRCQARLNLEPVAIDMARHILATEERLRAAKAVAEKLEECRKEAVLADLMEWADEMGAVLAAFKATEAGE